KTGIHAREWITQANGTWFANKLVSDHEKSPGLKAIPDRFDIFLEIVTNPDGYYYYTHNSDCWWLKTRKPMPGFNHNGVDANRNWATGFVGPGSSIYPCSPIYCGPRAHSEPEVKAILDFVNSHGNLKAFVSIHSYTWMFLSLYGYTMTPCKDQAELVST
ncbi:hypothetical protein P4O66_020541, partial [Electrophorus voltai]